MPMKANRRQKKIIIMSTGTARQNSTITAEIQRNGAAGSRRPMPKTMPKSTAPITATNAALTVIHSPGR